MNVLVRTADPRDTNSAALFAALAARVSKGSPISAVDAASSSIHLKGGHKRVDGMFNTSQSC